MAGFTEMVSGLKAWAEAHRNRPNTVKRVAVFGHCAAIMGKPFHSICMGRVKQKIYPNWVEVVVGA
ncbi:hypothetical protein GCM10007426_30850 [Alloalcanivorax dieselolei]|nr:hypothetical protein GCM10007426_30850 [Alloalcanivorax dieselolei]